MKQAEVITSSSHLPPLEKASEKETEASINLPQRTIPLAHADTAQNSLLVGLGLSEVLAHNVPTQAEAHHNQLGLWVGLFDVANHGSKFPGATCKKGKVQSNVPRA